MSEFQSFDMERYMSLYEQTVEYNLSESGVEPVRLGDLLGDDELQPLLDMPLGYPQVNGIPELRQRIASLYDDATPANVLVTVGAAEANYLATRTLVGPGEGLSVMLPNYMQIWGIARNHDCELSSFHLNETAGWELDLDQLEKSTTAHTRLLAVCNPNNPTGHILTEAETDAVVSAAARVGAWILSDEVYSGSERRTDAETPSFYGRYDKVLAVGSLSKAYGLPGLRIGWVVGPPEVIEEIWKRHEYVVISATKLGNHLAARALDPEIRLRLISRTRRLIREGYGCLEAWMASHPGVFHLTPPQASAVAFVRYDLPISSLDLADRLREEKGVLVVPGEHFGLDHFIRISFGLPEDYLTAALDRLGALITELQESRSAARRPT